MTMPLQSDVDTAKSNLTTARQDVRADEHQIKHYQSGIKDLEDLIQGVRDGLLAKQLAAEDAEASAEKILREIEEAIDLHIKAMESSVLQGGTATFEAVYDKSQLATGDLKHDLHVQLLWDTGGCSIQPPQTVHSEKITVDTSPVQPGDYGISVSLTFI
jgi:hypothetical protein